MTRSIPRQADPPSEGGADNSAGATAAGVGGGDSGFTFELPTLWQLLTDTAEEIAFTSPTTMLLDQLEDSPRFRRGQVAGALADLQEVLEKVSHTADGTEPVSLQAGTVLILAHTLLRHQP